MKDRILLFKYFKSLYRAFPNIPEYMRADLLDTLEDWFYLSKIAIKERSK